MRFSAKTFYVAWWENWDRKDEGGFENRYLKQEKERVDREEEKNKKKRKRERVDRCIDNDLTTW